MRRDSSRGFFGSLFDFSFSSFISTTLIKLLYGLSLLGAVVATIALIAAGFDAGTARGIATLLIGAPIAFFVMVIYARIMAELMIVLFRISENVQEIADRSATE